MPRDDLSGRRPERVRDHNRTARLSADQIERLRRRVAQGYYAAPRVANEIARCILERENLGA